MASTRISYPDGCVYDGQWSAEGKRQGKGLLVLSDGSVYRGEFHNGFYQGHGVLILPDGSLYEGMFETGQFSSYGVFQDSQGTVYQVSMSHYHPPSLYQ